jgi:hypothetical protein
MANALKHIGAKMRCSYLKIIFYFEILKMPEKIQPRPN